MADIIVNNDVWEVRVYCRNAARSQLAVNVSHWLAQNVVGTPTRDDDLVEDHDATFAGLYKAILAPNAQYYGVDARRIHPAPPSVPANGISRRGAGTATGDQLPSHVAALFTKKTVYAGRGFRGRMFIPFLAEGMSDASGEPTAGCVTALQAIATAYAQGRAVPNAAGTGTVTMLPILWHREPRTWDLVFSAAARTSFATQRRRGTLRRGDTVPF